MCFHIAIHYEHFGCTRSIYVGIAEQEQMQIQILPALLSLHLHRLPHRLREVVTINKRWSRWLLSGSGNASLWPGKKGVHSTAPVVFAVASSVCCVARERGERHIDNACILHMVMYCCLFFWKSFLAIWSSFGWVMNGFPWIWVKCN